MVKKKAKPKAKSKDKKPRGRPTKYTEKLGLEICKEIATSSEGLKALCAARPDWPSAKTVHAWRLEFEDFRNQYMEAKRIQADLLVEDILEIADDTRFDTLIKEGKDGSEYEVANTEWITRCRLRVDARKWIACKLLPKVYGDKVDHDHNVTVRQEDAIEHLK